MAHEKTAELRPVTVNLNTDEELLIANSYTLSLIRAFYELQNDDDGVETESRLTRIVVLDGVKQAIKYNCQQLVNKWSNAVKTAMFKATEKGMDKARAVELLSANKALARMKRRAELAQALMDEISTTSK